MENKTSKYFKYAIGEIILVVIGILIALQINNWNEKRKQHIQEKTYLIDIKDDLLSDINTLTVMVSKNEDKLSNIHKILTILTSKESLTKQKRKDLLNLLNTLFTESYFIPEKGTINQIESSSSGNIIQNKTLRDLIFRYYSNRGRHEKNMEQSLQLYQHNYITPSLLSLGVDPLFSEFFFGKKYNLPKIDASEIVNNREYISAIGLKFGVTKNQNISYRDSKKIAEQIISLINNELNID